MTTAKTAFAGTQRAHAPHETLARVKPYLRAFGITRIANVTGMDCIGIPTVIVSRPNGRSLSVTQGKGATLDAARASGVMEAIEQSCAEQIELPLRLARATELQRSARLIDTSGLPRFVRKFGPNTRSLWIEGRELTSGEPLWVPYGVVHLDFTLPLPEGSGFFLPSSNGLASGNQRVEALVHGLAEVIERDAVTLFYDLPPELQWLRRLDLDTVDDNTCRELLEQYRRAAVDVAVWDVSSDVGVAAFLCSVLDRDVNAFRTIGLARGAGCHTERGVALARALCEAAQSRLTRITGSRDDISDSETKHQQTEQAAISARAHMVLPAPAPRRFSDVPTFSSDHFEADLDWMRARLRASGLEQIVEIDLSPKKCPVSVVRLVVPGLEAAIDIPNYQPGRRMLRQRERTCAIQ
jgi:ribosomal protein S12 methylthiotransferase accessory factor